MAWLIDETREADILGRTDLADRGRVDGEGGRERAPNNLSYIFNRR